MNQYRSVAALLAATTKAYSQSLADCNAFAGLFANTCSGVALETGSLSTATGVEFTCTGDLSICAGDDTKTKKKTCSHNQVLCVTCADAEGEVRIRVQSNSLPNHCWRTSFINNVTAY